MNKYKRVFILMLALALIPLAAWANMAIPIENPVDQKLVFNPDPGITMVEEIVAFNFEGDKGLYTSKVHVSYVLRNEAEEDKQVEMVFVTPYMGEEGLLKVVSEGKALHVGQAEQFKEMPQNWAASSRMSIVDPIGGEILENSPSLYEGFEQKDEEPVWGTYFSLDLPSGEDRVLEVFYDSQSGYYRYQNVINNVFSQIYYLTPAKFYEGNPKVTLKISFPEDKDMVLHSNIPMHSDGGNTYAAELDGLPEEEWLFSFVDKNGLPLGTNDRTLNNGIVLAFFALVLALSVWIWKKKRKKAIAILGGVIGAGSLVFFRPSYGMIFMFYLLSPLIGIGVLVFAVVWLVKKGRSKEHKL